MPTISFSWNMWHRVAYGQFIWINTLKQKQRRRNDEGIPHVCLFVDSYRSNGRRWTSKCSAPSSTLQTTPVTAVTLSRAETSSRSLFHLDPGKTFIYCTLNMLTQTHKLTVCVCFRHVLLVRPVCFEKELNYTIQLNLPLYSSVSTVQNPYTLIDSVCGFAHKHTHTPVQTGPACTPGPVLLSSYGSLEM